MSLYSAHWMFSTLTTAPPTGSEVRLDAAYPYTAATTVWIRTLTQAGVDVKAVLVAIPVGATLYLQDKDDGSKSVRFVTAGAVVDAGTYVAVPVTHAAHGGALPAQQIAVVVITEEALPTPPPAGGPGLVTLAQVKAHLKLPIIADDPGDVDLQLKRDAAEAAILDYIGRSAAGREKVASWTAAVDPVPAPWFVIAAILLEVGELWRFRGDDPDDATPAHDPDGGFSPAIVSLLRRVADPVLA